MAAVFAALLAAAVLLPAHLDEIANPADANYVPRPEWYFLSLFQLLKYVPGPARDRRHADRAGAGVAALFALPFLDRGGARHPWAPARRRFTAAFAVVGLGVAALTWLGLRDAPTRFDPNRWGPQSLAGYLLIDGPRRHLRALPRRGRTGRAGARHADQPRRRLAAVPHGRPGGDRAGCAAGVDRSSRRCSTRTRRGRCWPSLRRLRAGASPPRDPRRRRRADRDSGHPLRRLPHAGRRRRHHRSGSEPRRRQAGRGGHPPHHHRPERRVRRLDDADLRQPPRRLTRSRRWPTTWRQRQLEAASARPRRRRAAAGWVSPWWQV